MIFPVVASLLAYIAGCLGAYAWGVNGISPLRVGLVVLNAVIIGINLWSIYTRGKVRGLR